MDLPAEQSPIKTQQELQWNGVDQTILMFHNVTDQNTSQRLMQDLRTYFSQSLSDFAKKIVKKLKSEDVHCC